LGKKYDILDFEIGNKITGNGFPVYKGKGARLQRAIINFCLDTAIENGFTEYEVPILVNKETVFGTGQYPDKENAMYHIEKDDLYLVPTAEVPLTNIYRNVTIEKYPIKMVGYTPCFRRETGHYGKNIRGLNRVHQFDKVELVCITKPEEGYRELENLKNYIENLLKILNIRYRIVRIGGRDLLHTAAKAFDIEGLCGVQNKWLELVTVANFETFQANRLNCKIKTNKNKELVHTLNGTGLALPRLVAIILENNQTDIGIKIPDCLIKYTGFEYIN
jgi:seryl-tRNA synthetase